MSRFQMFAGLSALALLGALGACGGSGGSGAAAPEGEAAIRTLAYAVTECHEGLRASRDARRCRSGVAI